MRRHSSLTVHWLALTALVILAVLGVLALTVPKDAMLRKMTIVLWNAVPVTIAICQYLYSRIERFRLTFDRLRFLVLNPGSTWGFSAEFDVEDLEGSWQRAEEWLKGVIKKPDRLLNRTKDSLVWVASGTTLVVRRERPFDPLEGQQAIVRLELPPITRPFREWEKVIQEDAVPVVEGLEAVLSPTTSKKYVSKVAFPGQNP
jgi:hypothetical protein